MKGFASDNYAGAHPRVLDAVVAANADHAVSYGADPVTERLEAAVRAQFGAAATVFPVFNGTGANVLSFEAVTQPWEAIVCTPGAHVNVDECGAPERAGRKLLVVGAEHGKLSPETVRPVLQRFGDEHAVQPKVLTLTNSTELGTLYTPDEVRALVDLAHEHGLLVHVDGARIANAAAALGTSLAALTTDVGVDVLSLGGTKAGALGAEAVVFLREDLGAHFKFQRKQAMHLASKMRFLSAQLVALFEDELWRETASHANAMAARLADGVRDVVEVTRPVQANAVFALVPPAATEALQRDWRFYVWDELTGEVRWMCAWDTQPEEVDAFAAAVRDAVGAPAAA